MTNQDRVDKARQILDRIARDGVEAGLPHLFGPLDPLALLPICPRCGEGRVPWDDGLRCLGCGFEGRLTGRERMEFVRRQQQACRHCGSLPDDDGDHSCPCPYRDGECPDHD